MKRLRTHAVPPAALGTGPVTSRRSPSRTRTETRTPKSILRLAALAAVLVTLVLSGCDNLVGGLETLSDTVEETRTALIDPEQVRWSALRNMTARRFEERNNEMRSRGLMMVDMGFDETAERYHAVWHENIWHEDLPGDRRWQAHWDLSLVEIESLQDDLSDAGYRMVNQATYVRNGQRLWAGIWLENREDLEWRAFRAVTTGEYATRYSTYKDEGFMPVDVEAYMEDGDPRYAGVWVKNVDDFDWTHIINMTPETYGDTFQYHFAANDRLIDLISYTQGGNQYFAAIWVDNRNRNAFQGSQEGPEGHGGRAWGAYRDMSPTSYGYRIREMTDRGYRPLRLAIYDTDGGTRVAAVWRQNAMRATWEHRNDVDADLEAHMENEGLPSISAAIMKDGVFVYRRGFGYRDVENQRPADARTSYRLASVSKAVGGIIGMRLHERGDLDVLADVTRTHVPDMGSQHGHTLAHLYAHQGCLPHYAESVVSSREYDSYDTAFEAAEEFDFWDNELLSGEDSSDSLTLASGVEVCGPGEGYRYSTPGYTLLGAAFESVTGTSIADLVEAELSTPFGLTSLRAEDRSIADEHRARIYNDSGTLMVEPASGSGSVDDLSWKVLGGGMEAHVYDMARLGQLLIDGELLEPATRDLMWTAVTPSLANDRTIGWRRGTHLWRAVRWHTGRQLGGNASWLVYPDANIVVVVLSNRRSLSGGAHVGDVAWTIAGYAM